MGTIDVHSAEVTIGSALDGYQRIPLEVLSMEVSQDIDRTPFVSLTLTAKRPTPETLALMDPRLYPLLLFKLARSFDVESTVPDTLADVTDDFAGTTLATVTATGEPDLAGFSDRYPGAAVTTELPHLPGEFTSAYSQFLYITNVVENYADDTVTVTAESGEYRLDNHKRVRAFPLDMASYGNLYGIVANVLSRVGGYLSWVGGGETPTGEQTVWQVGQSAREFLNGLLEHRNLRVYANDFQSFAVAPIGSHDGFGISGLRNADFTDGMIDAGRSLTIGDTAMPWYDAVVIVYKWTDLAGVAQTAVDPYPTTGEHTKALSITRDTAYPGPGAAQGMLARSQRRGFDLNITTVSDYHLNPAWRLAVLLPEDTVRQEWTVQALTFNVPQAEMSVRLQPYIEE